MRPLQRPSLWSLRRRVTPCSAAHVQVTDIHNGSMLIFDVIAETLRATNLGTLVADSSVNFERCACIAVHTGPSTSEPSNCRVTSRLHPGTVGSAAVLLGVCASVTHKLEGSRPFRRHPFEQALG